MRCSFWSSLSKTSATSLLHFFLAAFCVSSLTSCSLGVPPSSSWIVLSCWFRRYSRCCLSISSFTLLWIWCFRSTICISLVRSANKAVANFVISSISSSFWRSSILATRLLPMKFTINHGLSILRIANVASKGTAPDFCTICIAISFTLCINALNWRSRGTTGLVPNGVILPLR